MLTLGLGSFVADDVAVVSPDMRLADCLRLMQQCGEQSLPVVDSRRKVLGTVSDLDLARAAESRLLQEKFYPRIPEQWSGQGSVADLMERSVATVDQAAGPRMALEAVLTNKSLTAPVVEDGRLVGMVSGVDFLREFSCGYSPVFNDPVSWHMSGPARQISAGSSILAALEEFKQHGGELLTVVQDNRPLGVVAAADCHRAQLVDNGCLQPAKGCQRHGTTLRQLLAAQHVVLSPDQTLGQAAQILVEQELPGLVVVDRLGRAAGVLSTADILSAMLDYVG